MFNKINRRDQILVKIAFSNKLIDKNQLAKAFSIQKKREQSGEDIPIDEIFLQYGMIPETLIQDLRTATKRSLGKGFGVRAIKRGWVTRNQLEQALDIQAKEFSKQNSCRFVGEILVDQGIISEKQRQDVLKEMETVKQKASESKPTGPTDTGDVDSNAMVSGQPPEEEAAPEGLGGKKDSDPVGGEGRLQLVVSEDQMEARIVISGDVSRSFTMSEVDDLLEDGGIDYQLVDETSVQKFLQTVKNGKNEIIVATGEKPIHGKDATIQYYFETEYLGAGRIEEDGTIDYKERGAIPHVAVGDLIAEKTPFQEGKDGFNVLGEPVPAREPEDKELICDSGTEVSEDGLKVYAAVEGQPNVTVTGKISVFDEFRVKGDVDYNTGNIEFDGNIIVEGAVKDGFSVKGGNLIAQEVHQAEIHLKGDLSVNGGIFGSRIQTEGQVIAKYIKDANIKSYGDVVVDKEVMDSKIRTSGRCVVERGKIISSLVTAKGGIEVKDIGTDVSPPCTIKVGMEEHIRKIIQGFKYTIDHQKKEVEKHQEYYQGLLEKQKALHHELSELTQAQDRAQTLERSLKGKQKELEEKEMQGYQSKLEELLAKVRKKYQEFEKEVEQIFTVQDQIIDDIASSRGEIEKGVQLIERANKEKDEIIKWSKKGVANPIVVVKGSIYGRTLIIGPNSRLTIGETQKNVTIKEIQIGETEKVWKIEILKGAGASAFKKA